MIYGYTWREAEDKTDTKKWVKNGYGGNPHYV